MARFVPDQPPPDAPESELKLRGALARLDDNWTVFHSVTWQSRRGGREGDGEADFVLMHPESGLLVVEVKGGAIDIEDGRWYSTNRRGERNAIKNPYEQAVTSKHTLLRYLRNLPEPLTDISVNHAVCFPDITVTEQIGTYGPNAITWDQASLRSIGSAVATTIAHWVPWGRIAKRNLHRVTHLLAPTLTIRRTLADQVADANAGLIQLSGAQARIFSQIHNLRAAVVEGRAGTGKTLLAMERVRVLSKEGFSVLLTCYNALLAEFMRRELGSMPDVTISTFHALCLSQAAKARIPTPAVRTPDWWEHDAADILIQACDSTGFNVNAVVVDEGQDFSAEWIDALRLIAGGNTDAPFYVFRDVRQGLYQRRWEPPADWVRFELDMNCRNTDPIATTVARIFGDDVITNGINGTPPTFVETDVRRDGVELVHGLVARLMEEENIRPEQICVLADDRQLLDRLKAMSVGDAVFCDYWQTGVAAETVARFKGLEADVIIAVFRDPSPGDEQLFATTAYVGLSRAKSSLFVFGSHRVRDAIGWNAKRINGANLSGHAARRP